MTGEDQSELQNDANHRSAASDPATTRPADDWSQRDGADESSDGKRTMDAQEETSALVTSDTQDTDPSVAFEEGSSMKANVEFTLEIPPAIDAVNSEETASENFALPEPFFDAANEAFAEHDNRVVSETSRPTGFLDAPNAASGQPAQANMPRSIHIPLPMGKGPFNAMEPGERSPADELLRFAPSSRGGSIPPDSPGQGRSEGAVPRLIITVGLDHARILLDEAAEVALQTAAPNFRKLVQSEIEQAEWRQKCERRAADYTLR